VDVTHKIEHFGSPQLSNLGLKKFTIDCTCQFRSNVHEGRGPCVRCCRRPGLRSMSSSGYTRNPDCVQNSLNVPSLSPDLQNGTVCRLGNTADSSYVRWAYSVSASIKNVNIYYLLLNGTDAVVSRIGRTEEYQLLLMKASDRGRNVKF